MYYFTGAGVFTLADNILSIGCIFLRWGYCDLILRDEALR